MTSETTFVLDPNYSFEPNLAPFVESNFEEKPPLTALGEVIELIGQPWGNDSANFVQKPENSIFSSSSNICKICFHPIHDQFLFKIGESHVHEHCSRCIVCNQPLGDKCYEKNNQFYCHLHYYSEHSPFKCSGCRCGISPTDMVYKLKDEIIYHVSCHSCFQCGKQLTPGEQIVVDEITKLVSCSCHQNSDVFFQDLKNSEKEKIKPILTKKCNETTSSIHSVTSLIPQYPFEMYAFGEMCGDDSRFTKRRGPRTTIKQSQLDVLNRIFSSTPKPSKHARAKLALETGLSMRVIQVWFQNRRSKERRLKHLCNFLRHYEQKGIVPPPFGFNPEDGTLMGEPLSPSTLQSFDPNFSFEEDSADLSS